MTEVKEGTKLDDGKLRTDLLPVDAVKEVAKVLTLGAQKYADRNWEQGINYSRVYAAALRHMFAMWDRQDVDPESNLLHAAHAATNLLFLLAYQLRNMTEFDDRPKR